MSNNDFVAVSPQMNEVKKVVNLVKGIKVNTLIVGESGSGKSKIASCIMPNVVVVNGADPEDVSKGLKNFNEVIIEDFDAIRNYDALHIQGQKIVATASKRPKESVIDKFFGIVIELEPLSKRADDIAALMSEFLKEAKKSLMIDTDIDISKIDVDIAQNCHSLKRSVFKKLLSSTMDEDILMTTMRDFFVDKVEMEDNYAYFLNIFDKAIIHANHKMYKSQLMMSYKMGINRNTLRKKINELGLDFATNEG